MKLNKRPVQSREATVSNCSYELSTLLHWCNYKMCNELVRLWWMVPYQACEYQVAELILLVFMPRAQMEAQKWRSLS